MAHLGWGLSASSLYMFLVPHGRSHKPKNLIWTLKPGYPVKKVNRGYERTNMLRMLTQSCHSLFVFFKCNFSSYPIVEAKTNDPPNKSKRILHLITKHSCYWLITCYIARRENKFVSTLASINLYNSLPPDCKDPVTQKRSSPSHPETSSFFLTTRGLLSLVP